MFKIGRSPISVEPGHADAAVIDTDRGVWMRREHSSRDDRTFHTLRWGTRVIPFTVIGERVYTDSSAFFEVWTIAEVGVAQLSGLTPFRFQSREEEEEAKLLIAEAMIVFGGNYNGEKEPDGLYRVKLGNKTYTKRDFNLF